MVPTSPEWSRFARSDVFERLVAVDVEMASGVGTR